MPLNVVHVDTAGTARVEVQSPLERRDLRALPGGRCTVQFAKPLSERDHERLAEWFAGHPDADLRAYSGGARSLGFLRHYPRVSGFSVDCCHLPVEDASGLAHLPDDLERLTVDVRLPDPSVLDTLGRFRRLTTLRLGGTKRLPDVVGTLTTVTNLSISGPVTSLDVVSRLTGVTVLRLDSVSGELDPLLPLARLADLTLALGGVRDLTPLPCLPALRRFAAWLVRGLSDVQPLGDVTGLERLHLESLKQVTALPDLRRASALREVTLQHMRGLRDLSPLRDAPALERLELIEMEHLRADEVAVLVGHPALRHVGVGLGSHRKNLAARDALRIPGSYGGHPWPDPTAIGNDGESGS